MNKYAFRKGERISGFEHKPPEILVYKIEDAVTLKISQDGAQLHSKDKVRDTFIHKFYSGSTITKIINAKKKYHFPEFIISEVKEYEFNMFPNVIKFYMPSQLAAATNIKCTLSLDGKCKIHGSECSLDCSETIELMQTCDIKGAACYFQDGNLYSVVPGRFLFEVDGYNENCSLNLIAVQQLDEEVKQKLMQEMLSKCIKAKNPIERCIVIKKLTRISKCKDYLNQFADSLLCEITSITDKIDSFIKLNDEFCKEVEWNSYANKCAEQLFEEMCSEIDLEGFTAKNVLG
ncbi:MAG: hypothetical protein LIO65_08795, partial [Odoribacter sp.]|nr:hypothetical protein [Odoribacter sp.]